MYWFGGLFIMIITPYTDLQDVLTADEFRWYKFDIDRVTAVIKLLEYVKMDNRNLSMYLDDDCVMKVKVL